jgi:predicted ArsR family transcriptional regulator
VRKWDAVSDDFAAQVSGVGVLAEPARRSLYLFVVAQPSAVSREQAAASCGLALHTVKFHLDRLVEEGLLEVEFRRLSGRSGPGAGRPSKLYRRSGREVSVSLPERHYDLAGEILAEAIERSTRNDVPVRKSIMEVAEIRGRVIAASVEDLADGSDLARAAEVLARHGYEPRADDEALCLANCPFDRLARQHTELVCSMNLSLVGGVLDGLGCDSLEAVLEPEQGLCCVKAKSR